MPFSLKRFNIQQCVTLFFSTFFFFNIANAQHNYYFSSKAISEGNGTKQQPFQSLQKLAQIAFQQRDTIFFHSGDTLNGNIVLDNINGTKQHPVVFTSYGNGKRRCVINGKNKEAFVINSSSRFVISNLAFAGDGRKTGNTTDGLKLINCNNAQVKNIEVSGFQKSGLILYNCETSEVNDVYAHENGFAGILIEGDYQKRISNNIHIINCRADNNPGDPANLENHSGNGILAGNCKNILIEYCTATNNGWDMPRIGNGPVGIWAYEADSITIQHCISSRNKTAKGAADGGGFDLDGGVTNSTIQYCLSYENFGSGYGIFQYNGASKWNNNTVRYCISINDGNVTDKASSLLIWNGWNGDSTFTNFYAYNNFFYNNEKYAFGFLDQSQHKKFCFFNNVFVAADTSDIFNGIDSSNNDIFLGNVWMKVKGGFKQNDFNDLQKWAIATGYEQQAGKLASTTFHQKLFSIPSNINITEPHNLNKNSLLQSLCNPSLLNKGINIQKIFGIDVGNTDFFGNKIVLDNNANAGICEMK